MNIFLHKILYSLRIIFKKADFALFSCSVFEFPAINAPKLPMF
jgi:hypothetical protein